MAFKIESNLLDACALAILNRGDTYGYEITQEMEKATDISESTLYPVLRRLQQNKLCFTYDQPYQGRNRRYYSITEGGKLKLEEYKEMWTEYRDAIESLLLQEPADEADEAVDAEAAADDSTVTLTLDGDMDERGEDNE